MGSAFSRVSLVIDIGEDWYPPNTLAIRGPVKYELPRSRIVIHETLHMWQQLGQGFMTWLAAEDWQRLLEFERSGVLPPNGPRKQEFVRRDEGLGFSINILNEALTRYWDIHICGPLELLDLERMQQYWTDEIFWQRYEGLKRAGLLTGPDGTGYSDLAYTFAMEGAGGRYARPYQLVIEKTSPRIAGIVFPIAAYFAFQTSKPTYYFDRFVELLSHPAEELPRGEIESLWLEFYDTARRMIFPIIREDGERPLFPIVEIRESGLHEHPVYTYMLSAMMHYATEVLPNSPLGQEVSRRLPRLDQSRVGLLVLDIFLATPGIPYHRGSLLQMFPPPVIRFPDGQTWLLGYIHQKELFPEGNDEEWDLPGWQQIASDALEIDRRWARLVIAKYGGDIWPC